MDDEEINLLANGLLIKIHVIMGWIIPINEFMTELTNQFGKKMIESYSKVNIDEIEFAFRNYGTAVRDWGKLMNAALNDKYKKINSEVSDTVMREQAVKVAASAIRFLENLK